MALISIGDLAQSLMLKRQNAAAKAEVQRLTVTLSTGRVEDVARHVRGDLGPLAGLDASLARLDGYRQVTGEAARTGAALQNVVGLIGQAASATGAALLSIGQGGSNILLDGAGVQARQALDQAVGAMNTRVADRSLLAGVATDQPAVIDAATLLSQAETAVAGATSAADIDSRLQAWLDDPAGFAAQAYRGGAEAAPFPVADGEMLRLDVTAADPGFRRTLKGLLMGSLLTRGTLPDTTRADLARRSGEVLAEAAPDLAHLSARVGVAEARIDSARTRNSAEASALALARDGIVGVDGYDAATALQETQARLETLYTLTARLSRLKLADYL